MAITPELLAEQADNDARYKKLANEFVTDLDRASQLGENAKDGPNFDVVVDAGGLVNCYVSFDSNKTLAELCKLIDGVNVYDIRVSVNVNQNAPEHFWGPREEYPRYVHLEKKDFIDVLIIMLRKILDRNDGSGFMNLETDSYDKFILSWTCEAKHAKKTTTEAEIVLRRCVRELWFRAIVTHDRRVLHDAEEQKRCDECNALRAEENAKKNAKKI